MNLIKTVINKIVVFGRGEGAALQSSRPPLIKAGVREGDSGGGGSKDYSWPPVNKYSRWGGGQAQFTGGCD